MEKSKVSNTSKIDWYQKNLPKYQHLLETEVAAIFDEAQCIRVRKDVGMVDESPSFKVGDQVVKHNCHTGRQYRCNIFNPGIVIKIISVEVYTLTDVNPNKPFKRFDCVVKFVDGTKIRTGEINFTHFKNKFEEVRNQAEKAQEKLSKLNKLQEELNEIH